MTKPGTSAIPGETGVEGPAVFRFTGTLGEAHEIGAHERGARVKELGGDGAVGCDKLGVKAGGERGGTGGGAGGAEKNGERKEKDEENEKMRAAEGFHFGSSFKMRASRMASVWSFSCCAGGGGRSGGADFCCWAKAASPAAWAAARKASFTPWKAAPSARSAGAVVRPKKAAVEVSPSQTRQSSRRRSRRRWRRFGACRVFRRGRA